MLAGLTWLMGLTSPLFGVFGIEISWRDIILIGGGMFADRIAFDAASRLGSLLFLDKSD